MGDSNIEWCQKVWNPIRGCSRVSPGCVNCYAEKHAGRFCGEGLAFEGYATNGKAGARWTGKVELIERKLLEPLSWKAKIPFFMKQFGAVVAKEHGWKSWKGGDMAEWPEEFRVRQFPGCAMTEKDKAREVSMSTFRRTDHA